ncbi:VWA domain-containing protein [uncultured Gilliamella sp.]|uniref:vWA domain-containing protein n=1 Tax=uncultured Gilliamella sp. TaxID=1193505 RepID=UPI0025E8E866|nr:VWA domain-containing protein [uncultured Gilliamella sp.]
MKMIKLITAVGFTLLSFMSQATDLVKPRIQVQSELAQPIILENGEEKNYLRISLIGEKNEPTGRVPINLAIVIDRSGSMSGERIKKAKEAAILAVNMLNEDDTLSIIAYNTNAEVILSSTKVKNKQKIISLIEKNLVANGGTALFAGVSKGINQVSKQLSRDNVNRIILLSDGQANIGPSSVSELSELAIVAAKKNIAISTFGIGDDYNEQLMSSIASYSDGNHVFVDDTSKLENVFVREFKDVMSTVAQDIVITINLKDGTKPVRLMGRDGIIKGNKVIIKMNQLYANQERYVLLEVIPPKGKAGENKTLANIEFSYNDLLNKKVEKENQTVNIAYTNKQDVVDKAVDPNIIAESEIQKVILANDEAVALYNQGKTEEAKSLLTVSAEKLSEESMRYMGIAPEASEKMKAQMGINQALADAIEKDDAKVARKKMVEKQFQSRQNKIEK